ncbi:hypothetical protein BJX64DRAFT_75759 [Aspergillus heterothallicus]
MAGITDSMESIGRYFSGLKLFPPQPLSPPYELEELLRTWIAEEEVPLAPIGNLKPIAEIIRIRQLERFDGLRTCIDDMRFDARPIAYLAPLPLTVATYLLDRMLVQRWKEVKLEVEAMRTNGVDEVQHKTRVIRDSFLWLRDLVGPTTGTWSLKLFPAVDADFRGESTVRQNLAWLQDAKTTSSKDVMKRINEIWIIFEKNQNFCVRCAFYLAQLGAKGSWDPKERQNIQSDRVPREWFEYNRVISGLLVCGDW